MNNGVKFGDIHSITDWDLIMTSKSIGIPEPKTNEVEIPGRDGTLDIPDPSGEVKYNNRPISFEFDTFKPSSEWWELNRIISNYLHGQKLKVTLDQDPNYYYLAKVKVDKFSNDKNVGHFSISGTAEPYKYKQNETNAFYTYKGVSLLDVNGTAVKLRKLNDNVKDSIVYYNDKWCIAKNVGEKVFNGTETFIIAENYSTNSKACFQSSYGVFDGVGTSSETIQNLSMKNNRFEVISRVWDPNIDKNGACIQVNNTGARIFIKIERRIANKASELKSFLANNNLLVQYKLDTTEYIELSSNIQTMLSDLDTSYTIDGYSLQNGTPEPLKPIPIECFGDLETIMLVNSEIVDKLTLVNDRKRVVPTIKTDSSVTLKYDNVSTSQSAGTYKIMDFSLKRGNTSIAVIGDGTINFNYQEASL